MKRALCVFVFGILSGVVGAWLAVRIVPPPTYVPMGDLQTPMVLLIGFFVGAAIGVFAASILAAYLCGPRRSVSHPPIPPRRIRQSPTGIAHLFWLSAAMAVMTFCVSSYFSAWNHTGNWEYPIAGRLSWVIWDASNVAAPFWATCGLYAIACSRKGLLRLVTAGLLVMAGSFLLIHLPGQHQTERGGPTGEPNGTYGFALMLLCVFEWGIVLLVGLGVFGFLVSRPPQE